jgi:osmoprotectant transport system permease protein
MNYLLDHPDILGMLLLQHLQMTGVTMAIAISLSVPIALLLYHIPWLRVPVLGILSGLYTIPSLALIILLVPFFGLSRESVIAAMVLYTQVILVRNLMVGLQSIPPTVLEAAVGMGMNRWQRWWQIQVPLAFPIFWSGVRLSTVISIAIATIGAKFGAGGLGTLLFEGIAQTGRYDKIWAGAIAVSSLALFLNLCLLGIERWWLPKSLPGVPR